MCLSEPKAGSSLTHVTTRATRAADGGWRIKGQKMWISGGDHDLAENIVHLVLARIVVDDRPSEALSLFIVPRQRDDGSPNGIGVVGLNKKLGHRATSNCALAFGAEGECIGELLGPPHRGLQGMFHMMNEARIGVGTTAAAIAWAAYRYAARYAFDRLQGRHALTDAPARLVDHVDVRRMLLAQKAIAEGGLSLALHGACLVDDIRAERDAERRVRLGALLELLTPVIKHWCAERGVESNSLAIQVLGGAGYVRDHPLERHFRDQRLNPIHEGTNGILAIDLVVRKGHRGAGLTPLLDAIEAEARAAADDAAPAVAEVAQALLAGAGRLRAAFTALGAAEDGLRRSLAFASPLMLATGDLAVSWMWLKQLRALAGRNDAWAQGKRAAARHMAGQLLPQSLTAVPAALAGEAPYDALPPEAFADWA
jgi:butyryl-CoA dehydrogenase